MGKYIFDNLKDWGIVLEKLEQLSKSKDLGNHQEGLIRLLRFNDNWRLREAAIESLHAIEAPSFELIREVFRLVMREDLYYDVRILATDGLEKLLTNLLQGKKVDVENTIPLASEIIAGMERSLASPQPPIFYHALQKSLEQIKEKLNDLK
jgi:hypothetical protein